MDKNAFYLAAMAAGKYKELDWIIRAFAMTRRNPGQVLPDMYPYLEDGKWMISLDNGEEAEEITGADPKRPLFDKRDRIDVKKGDFPGLLEDMNTNLGRILWHHIVCVYAFGDKIPFVNKRRSVKEIETNYIAKRLTSVPGIDPGTSKDDPRDPEKIYVDELLAFTEAVGGLLAGLTQLFTPATTRKSLTTDPKVYEVRAQLLEKYKDQLHDPAIIALIKKELGKIDREWIKGDPAEDYLIGKKSYDVVRMKTLLMHGEENGFGSGNQVTLIPTSLNEGWNLEHLPDYANSLREGSYNRGYQTMLGGEATKFLVRVFQNNAITVDDCGTKLGLLRPIPVGRATQFIGYYILEGGKTVRLDESNISQYAGKDVIMRSPLYCKGDGTPTSFCARCMGDLNAKFPNALGTLATDIGSMMLGIFMKKAHGTELKTAPLDLMRDIR